MKSDEAIKSIVYDYIKDSVLMSNVNGKLSKRGRPKNSSKEDVIISMLANDLGQTQSAYVNVNVYVPDIADDDGQYDEHSLRIGEISDICIGLFESFHIGDCYFVLEKQPVEKVNGKDEHVINNLLKLKINNE